MKAKISEIFKSVQGEGAYQGVEQVFVRLFGCNLNCWFCDTQQELFEEESYLNVVKKIREYKNFHSVSFTGGEPLLQVDFLRKIIPELKKYEYKVYLETNGVLCDSLEKIIENVDIVSMDFKLPSSTFGSSFWNEHEKFLKVARQKEVFVKAVVGKKTKKEDLFFTSEIIAGVDKKIPLFLQPNFFEIGQELTNKINEFIELSKRYLDTVKISQQMHKIQGIK